MAFRFLTILVVNLFFFSSLYVNAQESVLPVTWPEVVSEDMLLGKKLFFDERLSRDNNLSCASCHQFDHGGSNPESMAKGASGNPGPFNTPSIFNIRFNHRIGWVGHLRDLDEHLDMLIEKTSAMGLRWPDVLNRLRADTEYQREFSRIYSDAITRVNVIRAIVAYEAALTTPSPFDAYLSGNENAVSDSVLKGFRLFKTYGCISCHQGKNFGGNLFQRLGVMEPYFNKQNPPSKIDFGRYNHTGNDHDRHVFRVPSLRNVADTAPYLHDGSVSELEDAVSLIAWHQLGRKLPQEDARFIVIFLRSLSGLPHPELRP